MPHGMPQPVRQAAEDYVEHEGELLVVRGVEALVDDAGKNVEWRVGRLEEAAQLRSPRMAACGSGISSRPACALPVSWRSS
ncbi:hypothetical protein FHX34_105289 [Actinoplanes teichomyceticus]|uniref:Uncharacterized protein n=1 Tax=Actinoplanes teichomyceticus TaxID=1867 RepID=A0A561VLD2_ACTTI|nr:hypothetical protein FHX34_105289 [Actinoplanes teichomyceticus]